jgi:signal transduction histidine kinase
MSDDRKNQSLRRRTRRRSNHTGAEQADEPDAAQLVGQVRRLLAEAQALSTRLAALNEVSVAMQASMATDEMLRVMARQARWVLDFQHCGIALRHEGGYRYQVLHGDGALDSGRQPSSVHADAITLTLRRGQSQLLHELAGQDAPTGMRSALVLPLHAAGEVIGTLNFYAQKPQHYTHNDLRIAFALSLQVAAIIQNGRLFSDATRARDELFTVLESIDDGVLVVDRHGRVVLLNDALRRALHLADAVVQGRRALWLLRPRVGQKALLGRSALRELWQQLTSVAQNGANQQRARIGGTMHLSDGRFVEWSVASLAATGVTEGYVVTVRDISARIALEQLRDDMTRMLVHDLRTPLTGLLMGLDLLELKMGKIAGQAQHTAVLQHARRSSLQLLEQVNTLLDVSKLEAGKLELERVPCEVDLLIERAITSVVLPIDADEQRITTRVAPGLPVVQADPQLVQRVLTNLLGNALKFSPDDGAIVVGAQHDAAHGVLEIWVEDDGPGVPLALRDVIFEKYAQVKQTQRRGTGLGLAFCKLVVEAHGGQIGVRDAPGGGSIFSFTLPV